MQRPRDAQCSGILGHDEVHGEGYDNSREGEMKLVGTKVKIDGLTRIGAQEERFR